MIAKNSRVLIFSALFCIIGIAVVPALINPDFTPIHLVRQADAIVMVEVKMDEEQGGIVAELKEVLKGDFSGQSFTFVPLNEMLMETLQEEVFIEGVSRQAVLYVSRSKNAEGKVQESAFMSFAHQWFSLSREDTMWWLQSGGEGIDLMAVWEGRTDMLLACTRYVLSADEPSVPVTDGFQWGTPAKIGQVPAPADYQPEEGVFARNVLLLPLVGREGTALLVASSAGDRVLFRKAGQEDFADITEELGIASASRAMCLGDFNRDGRADISSWDGELLRIYAQTAEGTFVAGGAPLALHECLGMSVLPDMGKRRHGLLVSTSTWPLIVNIGENGDLSAEAVQGTDQPFTGGDFKQVYSCLVADFDGDGVPDILQPFRAGALFYRGASDGSFHAPSAQSDLVAGYGAMFPVLCDFNSDGAPDVAFMGEAGFLVWGNNGKGEFAIYYQTGETDRFINVGSTGGAVGDLNNDGRQDFVILFKRGNAQSFFGRGFSTFGLVRATTLAAPEDADYSLAGQQSAILADLTGNGAQDLVMVLNDGGVWLVPQIGPEVAHLAVSITLPVSAWTTAPVQVAGRLDPHLSCGWTLTPGGAPGFLSRAVPGPLTVDIFVPGGDKPETREIIVEDGPIVFPLP